MGKGVLREFIDIGNSHLRNVWVGNYQDELLLTVLGEEVTLSVAKNLAGDAMDVVAIRMPDGRVVKDGLISTMVGKVFQSMFLAIILVIVGGIFVSIGAAMSTSPTFLGTLWSWTNPLHWIGWSMLIIAPILFLVIPYRHYRVWLEL